MKFLNFRKISYYNLKDSILIKITQFAHLYMPSREVSNKATNTYTNLFVTKISEMINLVFGIYCLF